MNYMEAPGSDVVESALPLDVAVTAEPPRRHYEAIDVRYGKPLTPAQLEALAAYARHGSTADAAHALGKSVTGTKNLLAQAYAKLGVYGAINAFRVLGWLRPPRLEGLT